MSTSDLPPDQEPTRVNRAAPPPGRGQGQRRTFSGGVLAAVAVAVLVVAGIGGYLVGHSSGDDSGQKSGYDKGVDAGLAQGRGEYEKGKPGYEQIYEKGKADGVQEGRAQGVQQGESEGERTGEQQGERTGFESGQQVGVTTGEREGVRQGAATVLGGFSTWADGAFYIVTVGASSTAGVPYTVTSRTQLQPATSYRLCDDGAGGQTVCQSAAASTSADTAGGATDTTG